MALYGLHWLFPIDDNIKSSKTPNTSFVECLFLTTSSMSTGLCHVHIHRKHCILKLTQRFGRVYMFYKVRHSTFKKVWATTVIKYVNKYNRYIVHVYHGNVDNSRLLSLGFGHDILYFHKRSNVIPSTSN